MKLLHDAAAREAFAALLETYAELLVGDRSPETVQKIKLWALYHHIRKTMPALAAHWSATHPEAKRAVRELFEDIKRLNEQKNRSNAAASARSPAGEPNRPARAADHRENEPKGNG